MTEQTQTTQARRNIFTLCGLWACSARAAGCCCCDKVTAASPLCPTHSQTPAAGRGAGCPHPAEPLPSAAAAQSLQGAHRHMLQAQFCHTKLLFFFLLLSPLPAHPNPLSQIPMLLQPGCSIGNQTPSEEGKKAAACSGGFAETHTCLVSTFSVHSPPWVTVVRTTRLSSLTRGHEFAEGWAKRTCRKDSMAKRVHVWRANPHSMPLTRTQVQESLGMNFNPMFLSRLISCLTCPCSGHKAESPTEFEGTHNNHRV